jgi:glycosyltransferase involved in cell wall biosynthesis
MQLIVLNYSMSSNNLVFSHQKEVVSALSQFFETVEVFTTEIDSESLPRNVRVSLLQWKANSPFHNVTTIIKVLYPVLIRNRTSVLFAHMTDVHAAILAPLTWILHMRHILWYAHANNSKYLVWASFFVSRIVSSTPGSCNLGLNKRKVLFINQGINSKNFPYYDRSPKKLRKVLYYGRLDPSKNIHIFPDLTSELNRFSDTYSIDVFGRPTNLESEQYLFDVMLSNKTKSQKASITFHDPIPRALIPDISKKYDIFLNLFSGSLDKTLIETTLMGMPVITWNREYCSQFGTWSKSSVSETLDFIIMEFEFVNSLKETELRKEIHRRLDLAMRNHSFDGWIHRLVGVLKGEESL